MDDLLEQFVIEGRELVQQANDDLLALERGGFDAARVDGAFRAIHTMKGSAGLFDMAPLGKLLHAAEDLMAGLRQAGLAPGKQEMDALLACLHATEDWIEDVARTGTLPPQAEAAAEALAGRLASAAGIAPPAELAPVQEEAAWLAGLMGKEGAAQARSALRYVPDPGCFFLGDDPLALVRTVPSLLALHLQPRSPWPAPYAPFACNLVILALSAAPADAVRQVFRFVADQVSVLDCGPAAAPAADAALRTLRVEAGRIEALADQVGELFAAQGRLAVLAGQAAQDAQPTGAGPDAAVAPALARGLAALQADLERLAGGMHRAIMALRMVPLDQSFRRLPRVVRETASRLGRDVRFSIEGAQVRADKATVDALFEPLLHVLRNAVDHGIQPPASRLATGKTAQGAIVLRAALRGGRVSITVTDDGAGIDMAALRRVAASRGLASEAALEAMDDRQTAELVFLPGFSTAAAVTDTSGRGVGMDAVRTALHAMGGQVHIAAAPDGGTVVSLEVPQSQALMTVLLVTVAGEIFGVPAEAVQELALVDRAAIHALRGGCAFVLRGRTTPLLGLAGLLGRKAAVAGQQARVVVAAGAGQPVGLEVDGFGARLEVLLRPLPALLAGMPGLLGSALLGDGSVLLVLDVAGLAA